MVAKRKKKVEKNVDDFSKELERLGNKLEKRVEKGEIDDWFHRTFGVVGPLLSSVVAIVIFAIGIRAIAIVNSGLGSAILQSLHDFFLENMGIFFIIILFFSYSSYISKSSGRAFRLARPVVSAIGIVVALWVAMKIVLVINSHTQVAVLGFLANTVTNVLVWIFWIAVIIGYLLLISGESEPKERRGRIIVTKPKSRKDVKRLYRSGKDKILGGVCGGIAEYLGVDPVVIRLLLVVGTLVSLGTGIIAYIIAWIIIPRNPEHRWDI